MSHDLLHSAEVKDLVRDAYRNVPATTEAVACKLYTAEELADVPASAVQRALGVANHLRFAAIRPGEIILDLGCGGGIDTILAARRTGSAGTVIALDFLPELLERTAGSAREAGLANVRTLLGELEAIPLPDSTVDLVISNGVFNLSPRKARVIAEGARVLRLGGRLCISDLTVDQAGLPPEVLTQPAARAGCVAGALSEADIVRKLERAGFRDVAVVNRTAGHRRLRTVPTLPRHPHRPHAPTHPHGSARRGRGRRGGHRRTSPGRGADAGHRPVSRPTQRLTRPRRDSRRPEARPGPVQAEPVQA